MLAKERKNKRRLKSSIIIIGSFLFILIGCGIPINKYYSNYKEEKQEEVQIDTFIDNMTSNEEITILNTNDEIIESYIAVIEIPAINLRKGIYAKDSKENTIEKNVAILKESDMPSTQNGNMVLVSHSGPSKIAYFNDLSKLKINDIAYIYYKGSRFSYKLVNVYEVDKTGEVSIVRNTQKNTLTLITCKGKEKKQLVFVFEQ